MSSKLLVEAKQVVIPGDILAEGMEFLPGKGAFREGEKVFSSQVGLVNVSGGRVIHIIPLAGPFIPKANDTVIGVIRDMSYSSWFVDIRFPYDASLSLRDASSEFIERGASLSDFFAVGDIILTKITNVTKSFNIDLTMKGPGLRKLKGGKVIEVPSSKVPRIVGKQGSMISLLKEKTGCTVFAGQNGRVWIRGPTLGAENLATEAIMLISENSHVSGLTEKVSAFLDKGAKELQK